MDQLSAIAASSRNLVGPSTLPAVQLDLDQIEAQSRRLVAKQGAATQDDRGRANYLLAQASIDASLLASRVNALDTSTTFSPLNPLQDTDVVGFLRHAHEQTLISTIEEGRRQTEEEFYRVLDERLRRDWEAKKKAVFERLGGKAEYKSSISKTGTQRVTSSAFSAPSLQMHTKMMAYDRAVVDLNSSRRQGLPYPIVHRLIQAAEEVSVANVAQIYHVLSKITAEPSAILSPEHTGAHMLNPPVIQRKYARAYLGSQDSRDVAILRAQTVKGAKEALEEQYWSIVERTVQAHPTEAQLGGDPSVSNRIRAFLLVRLYRGGQWEDRIELVAGSPFWAKLFYLLRTGHPQEALDEAERFSSVLNTNDPQFVAHLRAYVESPDGKLPKHHLEHVHSSYNQYMLHGAMVDPYKLVLYRLMGKIEPTNRRATPQITSTTEDWLWFQLAMIDEEQHNSLANLANVLSGYGEHHFEGPRTPNNPRAGVWANVMLITGQFEKAVAALYQHSELQIEAVHLAIALAYHGLLRSVSRAEASDVEILTESPVNGSCVNFPLLVSRYIRSFTRTDSKHAIEYVYSICLNESNEQTEIAWELCRKVILGAEPGAQWDELVGGFRVDGTRFGGAIESGIPLLRLSGEADYREHILRKAAQQCERERRSTEAIKLYNLAGAYETVVSCLATALGECVADAGADSEEVRQLVKTATDILRHYERTNRAVGKDRNAVVRLLRFREALEAKEAGKLENALEAIESTDMIPMDAVVSRVTQRAEEFKELGDAITRNLPQFLKLTMEILGGLHEKAKTSSVSETSRQTALVALRRKSKSIVMFATMLKYRMTADTYSYLSRIDVEIAL